MTYKSKLKLPEDIFSDYSNPNSLHTIFGKIYVKNQTSDTLNYKEFDGSGNESMKIKDIIQTCQTQNRMIRKCILSICKQKDNTTGEESIVYAYIFGYDTNRINKTELDKLDKTIKNYNKNAVMTFKSTLNKANPKKIEDWLIKLDINEDPIIFGNGQECVYLDDKTDSECIYENKEESIDPHDSASQTDSKRTDDWDVIKHIVYINNIKYVEKGEDEKMFIDGKELTHNDFIDMIYIWLNKKHPKFLSSQKRRKEFHESLIFRLRLKKGLFLSVEDYKLNPIPIKYDNIPYEDKSYTSSSSSTQSSIGHTSSTSSDTFMIENNPRRNVETKTTKVDAGIQTDLSLGGVYRDKPLKDLFIKTKIHGNDYLYRPNNNTTSEIKDMMSLCCKATTLDGDDRRFHSYMFGNIHNLMLKNEYYYNFSLCNIYYGDYIKCESNLINELYNYFEKHNIKHNGKKINRDKCESYLREFKSFLAIMDRDGHMNYEEEDKVTEIDE